MMKPVSAVNVSHKAHRLLAHSFLVLLQMTQKLTEHTAATLHPIPIHVCPPASLPLCLSVSVCLYVCLSVCLSTARWAIAQMNPLQSCLSKNTYFQTNNWDYYYYYHYRYIDINALSDR